MSGGMDSPSDKSVLIRNTGPLPVSIRFFSERRTTLTSELDALPNEQLVPSRLERPANQPDGMPGRILKRIRVISHTFYFPNRPLLSDAQDSGYLSQMCIL
jgi:hypothetical protein